MTQLREHLQVRGKVQTLSRARNQPMRYGVQLALCIARQIRPLGQVLVQLFMVVLSGHVLPWAVRNGKEHLGGELLC